MEGQSLFSVNRLNVDRHTYDFAVKHGKPNLIVQLDAAEIIKPEQVMRWIDGQDISVLNVAGPRESKFPEGIYAQSYAFLERLFSRLKELA